MNCLYVKGSPLFSRNSGGSKNLKLVARHFTRLLPSAEFALQLREYDRAFIM